MGATDWQVVPTCFLLKLLIISAETLQGQVVNTPTIIGVVGNTGAGKSSVINAMLDEERLVPTNWYVSYSSVMKATLINV